MKPLKPVKRTPQGTAAEGKAEAEPGTARKGKTARASKQRPRAQKHLAPFIFLGACLLLAVLLLVLPFSPLRVYELKPDLQLSSPSAAGAGEDEETTAPVPALSPSDSEEIELLFAGDVLIHLPILNRALADGGTPDFSWLFTYTRSLFTKADLAIANMEGTLTDEPYVGYPVFRAPKSLAYNLKDAGLNYMATANNHCMDGQLPGLLSTIEALRGVGLDAIGTRSTAEDPHFLVTDVKGIRLAISCYTYETDRIGEGLDTRTFNGNPLPPESDALIDSFCVNPANSRQLDEDAEALKQRVEEMKACSPDLIIFIMHWGDEYLQRPTAMQERYAQLLADLGVDLIIGSHPHVVQPLALIPSSDGKRQCVCYYSLGNFVSNQQPETGNTHGRAEEGAIARVLVTKKGNDAAKISLADYYPVFMYKTYPGFPTANQTYGWALPVNLALEDPKAFNAEGITARLEEADKAVREVMGPAVKP